MADDPDKTKAKPPESESVRATLGEIGKRAFRVARFALKNAVDRQAPRTVDMNSLNRDYLRLAGKISQQPNVVLSAQTRLLHNQLALSSGAMAAWFNNGQMPEVLKSDPRDKRFQDPAWTEIQIFSFIRQYYLLACQWLLQTVSETENLDDHTRKRLLFFTRQFTDAMAPTNFPLTNPQVLREITASGGKNLLRGLNNLLKDIERGKGRLNIRMTDLQAFTVGDNLANTPGKVVYQNDLMQLIQYEPTTREVYKRPLLVVPPWINKYYILDLGEQKSFIKYWVDNGFTLFVVSWVNPGPALTHKNFTDYMIEGPFAALNAVELATGERDVNMVGYCIGGTLLGATLAYMAARGDNRAKSATFLNSMLDFSDVGDIDVFIDEEMIGSMEKYMNQTGYLDGAQMAMAFNMLRANDLIWSFYVNNYLMGRDPMPFDLLYWNCDATRMPAAMHSFYLRNMYMNNRLREPGGISLNGEPIDLGKITIPAYFASTVEDHIAPWTSCYRGAQCLSGDVHFVLGGSGHIAGIINPPAKNKYGYFTNQTNPANPQEWQKGAEKHDGSWWPDWLAWARRRGGAKVDARQPGDGRLPVIETAPGSYVVGRNPPPTPEIRPVENKRNVEVESRKTTRTASAKAKRKQPTRKRRTTASKTAASSKQ